MSSESPYLLPEFPDVSGEFRRRVDRDYQRFAIDGPPDSIENYLAESYGMDIATRYAGTPVANPFGKASGQLSMTAQQVAEDVEAGLGFVVLKTVIARDSAGAQSMEAWAIKESRMVAERITGERGEEGWTVSWKGRGWWQSFEDYLRLVTDARRIAANSPTLIVPSCKYHLPTPEEDGWNIAEYEYTTRKLCEAWSAADTDEVMPLEKDFSPTLAGSDRAAAQSKILEWLRRTPAIIRESVRDKPASGTGRSYSVRVGLKIFNALFDDEFQLEMLRAIHDASPRDIESSRPDFFVYGNRLFDPDREFDGHRGIAYGGPDLSDRNLRVMSEFRRESVGADSACQPMPCSATGNIATGKMALEYALRGAENFQIHTFFQLPSDQYAMHGGSKTQKALHELFFHPQTGFVIWLQHLAGVFGIAKRPFQFRDVIGRRLGPRAGGS